MLTNLNETHLIIQVIDQVTAIEDNLDEKVSQYIGNPQSLTVIYTLYSEDGAEFKMLKELFCQTDYLRKIVSSAKENCCGIIEILCHRSGKQLSIMVNFLTVQKLQKRVRQSIISINN